jgi:dTDP-4-dehydrorhamnose 3,5-epimerase
MAAPTPETSAAYDLPVQLPAGVLLRPLRPHPDDRGTFVELHRSTWSDGPPLLQWNAVRSRAGVLRGVHAHVRHDDLVTVPVGHAVIGLHDLRPGSPTEGAVGVVEVGEGAPGALTIPHGVAHGFYFPVESLHVYAVSNEFDPADELGCRFDDPGLRIPWPTTDVVLSPRDRGAGPLDALRRDLGARAAVLASEAV